MWLGGVAFLLGVMTLLGLPRLPGVGWAALLPAVLWLALASRRARLPGLYLAGLLWALLRAGLVLDTALPPEVEGRDLVLAGRVADLPESLPRGRRLVFEVEQAYREGVRLDFAGRVRLSWYGAAPELVPGETWRITARLKRPHGFANPGGFDYEAWLFAHGLRATGYVRAKEPYTRLTAASGHYVARLRQALAGRIDAALGGHPRAGVVKALAVGLRQDIDEADWRVLRRTGTNHLMAISGLHIGLVAGLGYWLGRWLWSGLGGLALRLAAQRFAVVPALLFALGYAALAGFSVPTQRALVMITVLMVRLAGRTEGRTADALALALFGVLIWDPFSVLAAGFWLSFGAVAVILFGMGNRVAQAGPWWRWGRVHWVVTLGLTPLLLGYFGHNPLVSPLANLVAVPWMGLVVVPLVLAGALLALPFPALGGPVLQLAASATDLVWHYLGWLAGLDPDFGLLPAAPPWLWLAGSVGVLMLLAPRGLPGRWLGLLWLAPLIWVRAPVPAAGEAWLTLLDVGQGLSAVVRTRAHTLIFDTGPRFSQHFDTGRAVLLPFLRAQGVRRVDTLVISHNDNDHAGGAASLLAGVEVSRILAGEAEAWPGARACRRGQAWRWDGVGFEVLSPGPPRGPGEVENDRSCVLRVRAGGQVLLLPGDIERGTEQDLVGRYGEGLRADLLVAPHHGSTTSSTPALVAAVAPRQVLFSVGYRNRFGFPRAPVVQRYRAMGARMYDTATAGAIAYRLGQGRLRPELYRLAHPRLWSPAVGPSR